MDYAKEKPLLDQIEKLYEQYRATTDEAKRKQIYAQIDKVSGEAAKYAIASEYDKMLSSIGAKGTNAYTSVERTVYINDIPNWKQFTRRRTFRSTMTAAQSMQN